MGTFTGFLGGASSLTHKTGFFEAKSDIFQKASEDAHHGDESQDPSHPVGAEPFSKDRRGPFRRKVGLIS